MLVVENNVELTFDTNWVWQMLRESKDKDVICRINPEYQEYIKQLEDEVKALRKYIKKTHKLIEDNLGVEISSVVFSKLPPQTPEWKD